MVEYYIKVGSNAEQNIKTEYGVHVTGTAGLIGKPPFKETRSYSWDYLNGEWTDLAIRRYKPREITLHCWLETSASAAVGAEGNAVDKMRDFLAIFDTDKLIRLRVRFNQSDDIRNNLYYLVYLKDNEVKYKWHKAHQYIEFDIKLVEPSPEKMLYTRTFTAGSITVTYTSASEFEIDWGDGSNSYDLVGTNKTVTHTYASGTYVIIVSGVTKDITISVPNGTGSHDQSTDDER